MWLVITFLAMVTAIIAFFSLKKRREKYKLGLLVLMLTGTFLMVLVDHIMAYIKDGTFIIFTTNGLIKNATLLGIVMVLSVLAIWLLIVVYEHLTRSNKARV